MQCDLCVHKQIVLSYCDYRGTAMKTQGGGGQGDRPQMEPVLFALWNFPSGRTGLDGLGFLTHQLWRQWMLAFPALKRSETREQSSLSFQGWG